MVEKKNAATEKPLEGKSVKKSRVGDADFFQKLWEDVKSFEWDDNFQKVLGIALLIIGLRWLRAWLMGLIMIVLGILFLTGYFDRKKK